MTQEILEQVGPVDPALETSPIEEVAADATETPDPDSRVTCMYNGKAYAVGSRICQVGKVMVCFKSGSWGHPSGASC